MCNIGIISNWSPISHGYDDEEYDFVDYLKTKSFLIYDLTEYLQEESIMEFIYNFRLIIQEVANTIRLTDINTFKTTRIVIYKNAYIFKERQFVTGINNGLNKFQILWKKYYKQKMKHYKSIHNIHERAIRGKFKNFKFIH